METNKDQNIEQLVNKIMQHDRLETPSSDFTRHVMQHLEAVERSKATVYKPLISKPVWALIGFGVLGLIGFAIFGNSPAENTWMPEWNLNTLYDNSFTNTLSKIKFSSVTMYGVVFFALMLGIQIPLLKRQHDKKWDF